jgi:hypothetical protein
VHTFFGSFPPQAPSPTLPASHFQAEPVLPLSLIVLKRRHKHNKNSKWINSINIRSETLKLLQEGAGNALELIGIGNHFLNRTPVTQQLRERMDK